jgi:DNA helicase-2/ATP-dependent DNA helicase PcrA
MEADPQNLRSLLLQGLTEQQQRAVCSEKRRVLIVAGAGSGKTEVMARRIAWWVAVEQVQKDRIIAFTFTERAAAEMKFRIRGWIQKVTAGGADVSLGGMYIGTIHGFCLAKIREYWPDDYHNYDILDEAARSALILREFNSLLGLAGLRSAMSGDRPVGQYETVERFTLAYDQLHEHNQFEVNLPSKEIPYQLGEVERNWCKQAQLVTNVGNNTESKAFSTSAARYYAYLRCRRFLDFSSSQTELMRRLAGDKRLQKELAALKLHLVVDEVQDINPVQRDLIESIVGSTGKLTAVGDHRQAIYGFRGAKVEIIASLWGQFSRDENSQVIDLQENFRSTPRVIQLANSWAATIGRLGSMETAPMRHGNDRRTDHHPSHVALIGFPDRSAEAEWIANAIHALVPGEAEGAVHDKRDGTTRGLVLSDIAVLVRSSTDVRLYMETLERAGIPSVVRAGPDLFSQPEVLFFLSALAISAGQSQFIGSRINPKSLPNRIRTVLGCEPEPEQVLRSAAARLRASGLVLKTSVENRVRLAARAMYKRIVEGAVLDPEQVTTLKTAKLKKFLTGSGLLRRVFPQQLFHMLLSEADLGNWDTCEGRGQAAMFHLGALSGLITGMETPGWTSTRDFPWQVIGLCQYGAEEGRTAEQPLMVQPEAVTISTIHAVKGLEFACVFVADVNAQRFPSSRATQSPNLPLEGRIVDAIDIGGLSDNANHDGERRLMYVAVTRAERFLFISHSGSRTSRFIRQLRVLVEEVGGTVTGDSERILNDLKYAPKEHQREIHLATSFSDLRYYLECPHDFYMRKVLGFSPTIDQAFGYGRGVHNVMRAIHTDPKKWSALAEDRVRLETEIQKLVDRGLFYLRYTTGEPAENMRRKGVKIIADYITRYAPELERLKFEPEKEFETLIEYPDGEGGALVSGAIDIVRQDDPPRVTLIDFKSGDPESDKHQKLDEKEMQLQVAIYAIAARKELQYEPEQGRVRYLDAASSEKGELVVPLNANSLEAAKREVAQTAVNIRDRMFKAGPTKPGQGGSSRCGGCDFGGFCGMEEVRR